MPVDLMQIPGSGTNNAELLSSPQLLSAAVHLQPSRSEVPSSLSGRDAASPAVGELASTSSALYRTVPSENFSFAAPDKKVVSESRTWYCVGKEREFFQLQIVYSNISISASFQITAVYCSADGMVRFLESENYGASKLKKSSDGCSIQLPCLSVTAVSGGETTIRYDSGKSSFKVIMHVRCTSAPFQFGCGAVQVAAAKDAVASKFISNAQLTATIHIPVDKRATVEYQVEGIASIVHVVQGLKPHLILRKAWLTHFVDDHLSLSLSFLDYELPDRKKGAHLSRGFLGVGSELFAVSSCVKIFGLDPEVCAISKYSVPTAYRYVMSGVDFQNRPFEATLSVAKNDRVMVADILGQVPSIARLIIRTFIANPYMFLWYSEARLTLRVSGEPDRIFCGRAFQEHSILSE